MAFDEFTVALRDGSIYYGVPAQGHRDCFKQATLREDDSVQPQQVTRADLGAANEYCAACGRLLIQRRAYR